MDPLETVKLEFDSSFAIGMEAQQRGYKIFHYLPKNITYHGDKMVAGKKMANLTARGQFVTLQQKKGDHFTVTKDVAAQPLDECTVVWLRQDPPFDMNYITNCHLLELLQDTSETMVFNNPRSVRSSPEKLAALYFAKFMPKTIISANLDELQDFHHAVGNMIMKPLHGNGGAGVAFLPAGDPNLAVYLELQQGINKNMPVMGQEFIKNVSKGDKRIILIDGEPLGWFNRTPATGQIRANTRAGGGLEPCDLSPRDKEICAALKPWLLEQDLFFVGIDVIDGNLTEINVTSPTGIPSSDRLMGTTLAKNLWDKLEEKLKATKR